MDIEATIGLSDPLRHPRPAPFNRAGHWMTQFVGTLPSALPRATGGAIDHVPALDGLRGLAILLVLLHHFGSPSNFRSVLPRPFGEIVNRLFDAGWAGVDLFFVISGFLITSILLSSRFEPSYYRLFYWRRVLRILPLHFGVLLVGVVVLPLLPPPFKQLGGQSLDHLGWLFFYMSNVALAFAIVQSFGVFDTLWSLAIEEQFYMVWPWLVRRTSSKGLIVACLVLIVFGPVARAIWLANGLDALGAYRLTIMRLDGLALGGLLAVARHAGGPQWAFFVRFARWALLPLVGALFVTSLSVGAFYPTTGLVLVAGHTMLNFFFSSLLVLAASNQYATLQRTLTQPWLTRIGLYSYGTYVLHWPLLLALQAAQVPQLMGVRSSLAGTTLFFVSSIVGSVALGALSYHGYEQHFLKLRRFFAYAIRKQ